MTKRRKGAPSPDDLRLWQEVTRSVVPLADPGATAATPPPKEKATDRNAGKAPAQPARPATRPAPATRAWPALSPIDRRTANRFRRGTIAIDARIDLHGMTQAAAHGRLLRFLREAQADGAQLALVITGKGRPRDEAGAGEERGVLRRMVPHWLAAAEMRPFVLGFGEAGPAHGGGGALYVRVRRKKQPAARG